MKIFSAPDYTAMSRKAANLISAQVILKPDSVLGLATGSTPLGVYSQLIDWYEKGDVDFTKVRSVNLDEYCGLAPEHEQSYHYYMKENFFKHINIQMVNTHVPDGLAKDVTAEGHHYDKLIDSLGGIDLQLLGIGNTGHIGFNEPSESFIKETHRVTLKQKTIDANARFFASKEEVPRYAVTMGIGAIMGAKKVLLVANGAGKAEILYESLFGPITPEIPASILQVHPDVTVVGDEAAMAVIREKCPSAID